MKPKRAMVLQQRKMGASISQIADWHECTPDEVIDALVAEPSGEAKAVAWLVAAAFAVLAVGLATLALIIAAQP